MIKNYLLIAWRQIVKNKLYASINILGLVVGLAVYIFGSLLVDYERSHDLFYKNADRIYTAGSLFSPTANIGVSENSGIYTGFAPLILNDVEDVEAVARTVSVLLDGTTATPTQIFVIDESADPAASLPMVAAPTAEFQLPARSIAVVEF